MAEDENIARKSQRLIRDSFRGGRNFIKNSEVVKSAIEKGNETASDIAERYRESDANKIVDPVLKGMKTAVDKSKSVLASGKDKATNIDNQFGVSETIGKHIAQPTKQVLIDKGIIDAVKRGSATTGEIYGLTRFIIKPYFLPDCAAELLKNTKNQLTAITSTILQISPKEAENWIGKFGTVLTSKIAGVAGTTTLFALVSTYGTAGTGVAISNLSGAAATNATVTALGFGGGMATGALVLSGFGLAVGFATYKLFSSEARNYETLPEEDKQIIQTCAILVAAIDEKLREPDFILSAEDAIQFRTALRGLHSHLKDNENVICGRLDAKNSVKYRRHILNDYEPTVLRAFDDYSRRTPFSVEGVVGGVFYALISQSAINNSTEEQLVLEALKRSNKDLENASEAELTEYLNSLTPEQLQGVANNVKGIYHELLYVETYNSTHENTYAELHDSTNHEGSDVVIKITETDNVMAEYQLKATDNIHYVQEHFDKYDDIQVIATEEVAVTMISVEGSGHTNADMTADIDTVFYKVSDNTLGDRVFESAQYSSFTRASFEAVKLLQGQTDITTAGKNTLRSMSSAAAATGLTALLFG